MATANTIRNHTVPESERGLPPGTWVLRRGVKYFVPSLPPVQFARACHCGDYYATSCETCLTWAERDAERHQWAQTSKMNRHKIWDIITAKKSAA